MYRLSNPVIYDLTLPSTYNVLVNVGHISAPLVLGKPIAMFDPEPILIAQQIPAPRICGYCLVNARHAPARKQIQKGWNVTQ